MVDGPQVPKADTHYMGVAHHELKAWTDAGQPGDANDLGDLWKSMGSGLNDAAEQLMIAVFGSESGWTGQAADAMRAQLQKVAEWSQKTGDSYVKASQAFQSQGEAVAAAKSAMPDPVDYNPGQMIKDAAASGDLVRMAMLPYDMYKQSQASQEAHQRAADVVQKRDTELAAAAQSIPPFQPPPALGGENGKKQEQPTPPINGGPGLPVGKPRPGGSGGGSGGGRGGVPAGGGPGGRPAGGGGGPLGGGSPASGGSGGRDDRDQQQQQPPPGFGMPSLPMGTGTSGFAPSSGPSPAGGTGFAGPAGGAAAAGGGGGFGSGFGGGAFGPPGASGFGPTGSGNGAGAPGAAGGTGSGPGAKGAAGRGGAGGMGAGGHKGEGGEDEQHQRPSYLVEPDPDAMFGSDQMTAPPVIGG